MRDDRLVMGMPCTLEIVDETVKTADLEQIFVYFNLVEEIFSPFKEHSEVSKYNRRKLLPSNYSVEFKEILRLAEQTKKETNGYFDIEISDSKINPVGIVKGWAINNAANMLKHKGYQNFFIDLGGDIQTAGLNAAGTKWRVGIRNPFSNKPEQALIKVVHLSGEGIATSGNYLRGNHIYNPHHRAEIITEIVSFSVIGPNVYEADRFATAVFAMGKQGIYFMEKLPNFAGYVIDKNGKATMTSNWEKYL